MRQVSTALMYGIIVIGLVGCGKTIDQVKKTAHDLVDVAGTVYEDLKDNAQTAKKALDDANK